MEVDKVLKIFLNKNAAHLSELYSVKIQEHNEKIDNDNYPDSGFNLISPYIILYDDVINNQIKLNTGVSAAMFSLKNQNSNSLPYYLYARSSISKTPLRLANNVGIIDAGYRGSLIGVFDVFKEKDSSFSDNNSLLVQNNTSLLQVCSNDLTPFRVELVNSIDDLHHTWRGAGGFGSTGQ